MVMDYDTTESLRNKRAGINVVGTLVEQGEPRNVTTKYGETQVCDYYLTDEKGRVKITLWGDDIKTFRNGDKVEIHNGYTSTFKNEVQLNVPKKQGEILKITN